MSWREVIAATLDGTAGVLTGHVAPPMVLNPGDAWPSWASAEPSGATYTGPLQTWHVMVILPNSALADTIDAEDKLVIEVTNTLETLGEVTIVEPVTVGVADPVVADPLPALRFTLTTTGGYR